MGLAIGAPRPPSTRDAPFIETFQHNSKTLIYIAATHHSSVRYPNAMLDPVFKTIQHAFSTTTPDAVIIEGVEPSQVAAWCERSVRQCGLAHFNLARKACDESSFAAYPATQMGIPVYSGEPPSRVLFEAFERHGYSIQDYFAFGIINHIPYEKRHGPLTANDFPKVVEQVVNYQNYLLGTRIAFTAKDFEAWYAKHMQTPRNYLDIAANDTGPSPLPGEPNTLMHTFSRLGKTVRDQNIVNTIKRALKRQNRVLVVYGASHLDFEWKELVGFMGVPRKTKPF